MITTIVSAVVGLASTLGKSWIEKKKIKAEGKIKITQAKVDARVKREENLHSLDQTAASDMKFSWKDEFWSIIFAAILVSCFLPWTQPYLKTGFIFMKTYTPWWFEYSLVGIIAATFGLRGWNFWGNKK